MEPVKVSSCIVCGHSRVNLLTIKNDFSIWMCDQCGHGWVYPMPNEETLKSFYASEEAAKCQYDFPERSIAKNAQRLFRWIHQAKTPPGILLDVGSGRGVHLEVARKLGWEVVGIESTLFAREISAERGVTVYKSLELVEKKYGAGAFDLITLWEVIEHSVAPRNLLHQLRPLLKKGGVVALSTPNFNSVIARSNYAAWYEFRPPLHLHYFTPESLAKLMEQCGFHVLNQLTYGSWNGWIDRMVNKIAVLFFLKESVVFLIKVGCYKFMKIYFDYTLQSKMQGLGLLNMSSLDEWKVAPHFLKYF